MQHLKKTFLGLLIACGASLTYVVGHATYQTIADIPSQDTQATHELIIQAEKLTPGHDYYLERKNGSRYSFQASPSGELNADISLTLPPAQKKSLRVQFLQAPDSTLYEVHFDMLSGQLTWSSDRFQSGEGIEFSTRSPITDRWNVRPIYADWAGKLHITSQAGDALASGHKSCIKAPQQEHQFCMTLREITPPKYMSVLTLMGSPSGDDPSTIFETWTRPSDCTPYKTQLSVCDSSHMAGLFDKLRKTVYDMQRMTLELSSVMMQQVGIIGALIDSKIQLDRQLYFWEKQQEAYEDYHPEEQLCAIATMTEGLSTTETTSRLTKLQLSKTWAEEDQATDLLHTSEGKFRAIDIRFRNFQNKYCQPTNNTNAMKIYCNAIVAGGPARYNRDLNYAELVQRPRTIPVNFTNDVNLDPIEEDLLSMGRLLFNPDPLEFPTASEQEAANKMDDVERFIRPYQKYRSVSAIRNAARYSFSNLISMKAEGTGSTNSYIEALLQEFGMPTDDIERFVGNNPSYFSQMAVLTKFIYQHPNFYTNLITQPANVSRMDTTMEALRLMQNRDRFESLLRKEMLLSLVVEMKLRKHQKDVDSTLEQMDETN